MRVFQLWETPTLTAPVVSEPMRLRPSNAPKLEACIRYESSPDANYGSSRGRDLHRHVAAMLKTDDRDAYITKLPDWYARPVRLAKEFATKDLDILGVEETVQAYDSGERGTVDCYGLDHHGFLHVLDFKSGKARDYSAQLVAYARALMRRLQYPSATLHEFYLDYDFENKYEVTLESAETRVSALEYRWEHRADLPPTRCAYCGWCAVKNCPERRKRLPKVA